jgi:hypothetical protein
MSFLTLFAAGKSMIGMGDKNSPYRMRAANLLPKFESPKNPFAPKAPEVKSAPCQSPELIPADVTHGKVPIEAAPKAKPAIMETASLFDSVLKLAVVSAPVDEPVKQMETIPVAKTVVEKAKTSSLPPLPQTPAILNTVKPTQPETPAIVPVKTATPFSGWMKKINPLAYLPDMRSSKVKPVTRPKQAELSLEKIKVMRNHLNDADLEIKGAKAPEKKSVLAAKLQPLASAQTKTLDRLTTRFFGASSNQLQTHAQCQITTTIQ